MIGNKKVILYTDRNHDSFCLDMLRGNRVPLRYGSMDGLLFLNVFLYFQGDGG